MPNGWIAFSNSRCVTTFPSGFFTSITQRPCTVMPSCWPFDATDWAEDFWETAWVDVNFSPEEGDLSEASDAGDEDVAAVSARSGFDCARVGSAQSIARLANPAKPRIILVARNLVP